MVQIMYLSHQLSSLQQVGLRAHTSNATEETLSVQCYMCEAQFPRGSLFLEVTRGLPSWSNNRAGKMAQQVKAPATRLSGLSSIPGTHTVGDLIPTSCRLTSP